MMISMFQRAKSVSEGPQLTTTRRSHTIVQSGGADASLRAIREFRRTRVASKRIASRVA